MNIRPLPRFSPPGGGYADSARAREAVEFAASGGAR